MNRRQLLKVGGASILVAGAGLGGFAATRSPARALRPWHYDSHAFEDIRLRALSYAILSPNPHNRQPWLATLVGEDEIILTCELERRLPATDPMDRQITIGLGCFLEMLSLAAAQEGTHARITYFPEGQPAPRLDKRPVAHIKFDREATVLPDPLFRFAAQRRSNKKPYDLSRPIEQGSLQKLMVGARQSVQVEGTIEPGSVAALRDLSWRAHEIESYTPRTLQESIDLMRIGKAEIEANPDGIDLGGFAMELFAGLGFVDRVQMADQSSTAFKQGLEMYYDRMHSAMGHVWITTPDNSRKSQLEAGREWLRLNLRATGQGIAIHPLSQALQEYLEMELLYSEIHEKLMVEAPNRIQMFARIGYGPKVSPSPRWPVESRVQIKA